MVEASVAQMQPRSGDPDAEVTPEYVRGLTGPTDNFLCRLSDNVHKLSFKGFTIRDMVSNVTLVDVPQDEISDEDELSEMDDPTKRLIKYHMGPDFLRLQTVGLTMRFGIGPEPVQNLEMIERHYFRGRVLKDFTFAFGFVIPNSVNEWESIYDLPELTEDEMAEISAAPYEVKSDSFFFANGKLIVHNRAEYNYAPLDQEDQD